MRCVHAAYMCEVCVVHMCEVCVVYMCEGVTV